MRFLGYDLAAEMNYMMLGPRLNEACLLEGSWNENEKLGFDAQRQTHTIVKLYSIYPSLSVWHRAGTLYSADKRRYEWYSSTMSLPLYEIYVCPNMKEPGLHHANIESAAR